MAIIERDVYLLQRRRIAPIDIVYGSAVPIRLHMMDCTIPENAAIEFFAQHGDGPVFRCSGTASGNSTSFTPPEGFFQPGDNALQLEINGKLIPLALAVKCEDRISDIGSEETPEMVKPYVTQCQEILAENKAIAVKTPYIGANGNWYVWDSSKNAYADSGVGAVGPKGDAFTYSDFTPEQLAALKGAKGDPFTYDDFTPEQLENLKGPQGNPFTYDDFTQEQLAALKGNTGAPATLVSSVSEYQVGDSGTTVPTGSWGNTIPAVAQGKYLWTRVTQNFNTGNPVVFYAVSRNGMDGSGSVVTVNGVSPDARGNVALTANDIGAESRQKYGKLVVFGDSLGQGVNNGDYSFVDVLAESGAFSSVAKHCVGSATIGPYQVDSAAAGYSLVEQIERYSTDVAAADIIMLEYGANDISSLMAGKITMGTADDAATATTVCGYTKKALERILELNPDVKLIWLPFIRNNWQYLYSLRGAAYADTELLLEATALVLARPYLASVIPLADGITDSEFSSDGVHPNTAGHTYLANKILHGMFVTADYPKLHRPMTMTGDVESGTLALDGNWANIYQLISAGVGVQVTYLYGGSYPMVFYPGMYNAGVMIFNAIATNDGSDLFNLSFMWSNGGSITPHVTDLAHKITDISGTFNGDVVNTGTENILSGVKSGHVVTLSVEITVREDRTDTWGNFVLATGVPEAHAVTRAMAYFDGWQDFLYIEATTNGTINAILKGVAAGGKRIIGSITYIAAE